MCRKKNPTFIHDKDDDEEEKMRKKEEEKRLSTIKLSGLELSSSFHPMAKQKPQYLKELNTYYGKNEWLNYAVL